jgi:hypothetical protein
LLTLVPRAAIELKGVFQKLQEAEQSGLSAEHVRKLEEQASEQGVRVIWKVRCAAAQTVKLPLNTE